MGGEENSSEAHTREKPTLGKPFGLSRQTITSPVAQYRWGSGKLACLFVLLDPTRYKKLSVRRFSCSHDPFLFGQR